VHLPGGKLTRDGEINPFKGGVQKIIDRSPVPVLPMALRGLWGSLFSRDPSNPVARTFKRGCSRAWNWRWASRSRPSGQPGGPAGAGRALRGDWK
jgi:1-acyl-sn-glycerol-3-phosphate acyltransferase